MLMHDNRPRLRTATIVHVLAALVVVGGVAGFSESLIKPTEEGKVTFLRREADVWEVWIAKADGSDLRRLTSDGLKKGPPLWSPDGRHVAYTSFRDGHFGIYWSTVDGSSPEQRLVNAEFEPFPKTFTPDGKLRLHWT